MGDVLTSSGRWPRWCLAIWEVLRGTSVYATDVAFGHVPRCLALVGMCALAHSTACDRQRAWQTGAWPLYATQNAVRRRTWPLSRDSAVEEAGGEVRTGPPCFCCAQLAISRHVAWAVAVDCC